MKITVRFLLFAVALCAGIISVSAYENGIHFPSDAHSSFPLNFSPAHEFTADWSNKLVLHPEIFGTLDASANEYTLKVSGSGHFQFGRATWGADGKENWDKEIGFYDNNFSLALSADEISYIKNGGCVQFNAATGTISSIALEATPKQGSPDPVDPGTVTYQNGLHLPNATYTSLPVVFSPAHEFTSDWSNKIVLHPQMFPTFDTENYTYTIRVESNTEVQVGTANWSATTGAESDFTEVTTKNGTFEVALRPAQIKAIQSGKCLQFNNGSGSISKIELIVAEGGYVTPDYSKGGFHTDGTRLLDANDNEFVMRGINYSWGWNQGLRWQIKSSADWGFNTIRIQIGCGVQGWCEKPSYDTLKGLIEECEQYKLVAVFNVQDCTGSDSRDDLRTAANFFCQSDIVDLLNEHRSTVIVNINNEWPTKWCTDPAYATLWRDGYLEVVPKLREAAIHNTIMVDAGGYGQDYYCIPRYGKEIYEADEEHNLMFSLHMYQDSGRECNVIKAMSGALEACCPVVFGEMAFEHKAHLAYPEGGPVAWKDILDYSYRHNISWIGWSWSGNGGDAETCDMFGGDDWQPLENGLCLIFGPWGVKMTSTPCTVYQANPAKGQPYQYPDPSTYEGTTYTDPFPYLGSRNGDNNDLDPVRRDAGEDAEISKTLPFTMEKWHNSQIFIKPEFFATLGWGATLDIELSDVTSGESHLHFYRPTEAGSDRWTQVEEDFTVASGGKYTLQLTPQYGRNNAPARAADDYLGLRLADTGLYLTGRKLTVNSISVNRGDLTGVDAVGADTDNAPAEYYTLSGIRVATPVAGEIYIVRQGSKVTKVRM